MGQTIIGFKILDLSYIWAAEGLATFRACNMENMKNYGISHIFSLLENIICLIAVVIFYRAATVKILDSLKVPSNLELNSRFILMLVYTLISAQINSTLTMSEESITWEVQNSQPFVPIWQSVLIKILCSALSFLKYGRSNQLEMDIIPSIILRFKNIW